MVLSYIIKTILVLITQFQCQMTFDTQKLHNKLLDLVANWLLMWKGKCKHTLWKLCVSLIFSTARPEVNVSKNCNWNYCTWEGTTDVRFVELLISIYTVILPIHLYDRHTIAKGVKLNIKNTYFLKVKHRTQSISWSNSWIHVLLNLNLFYITVIKTESLYPGFLPISVHRIKSYENQKSLPKEELDLFPSGKELYSTLPKDIWILFFHFISHIVINDEYLFTGRISSSCIYPQKRTNNTSDTLFYFYIALIYTGESGRDNFNMKFLQYEIYTHKYESKPE